MNALKIWIKIALINLAIVATLGMILRSKMIFSLPFIDYKNTLHAHSHFAFAGWVTPALLALMTWQLLPKTLYRKKIYNRLIAATIIIAGGMLTSFFIQGYGFYSILFSNLFILVGYVYAFYFIRDILKTAVKKPVKLLSVAAVLYMVLSSAGTFVLAYQLATKSANLYLSKDAVYSYLHLQYNGFFTLSVFALLMHQLKLNNKTALSFAWLLNLSVLPSLFLSYLWHNPDIIVRIFAIGGSILLLLSLLSFLFLVPSLKESINMCNPIIQKLVVISLVSFILKTMLQTLSVIPSLGTWVFANRPVIIGFMHLVLLAFITLYLLAHFVHSGLLPENGATKVAIRLFTFSVLFNELVLFTQGLESKYLISRTTTNYLLLAASIGLFIGAMLISIAAWQIKSSLRIRYNELSTCKQFSES